MHPISVHPISSICDVRKRERNMNVDEVLHSRHLVDGEDSGQGLKRRWVEESAGSEIQSGGSKEERDGGWE
jgi:hypothetical protein